MTLNETKLKDALECLLETYIQFVDNACVCNDMYFDNDGEKPECAYCYAKRILKEVRADEQKTTQNVSK